MKELTPAQKKAIGASLKKHCVVIAVAGAGKTTVLEQRVRFLMNHGHMSQLIITFTKKAAQNLKNRLGDVPAGIFIGTFHSFCYKVLLEFAPNQLRKNVLTENQSFKIDIHAAQVINRLKYTVDVKAVSDRIEQLLQDGHHPDTWKTLPERKALNHVCYDTYQSLRNEGYMFFTEMQLHVKKLLQENKDVAECLAERYPIVKVDEFQDTDECQAAILKIFSDHGCHLFVVGDSAQSIYEWRGCRPDTIKRFPDIYGESERIVLDTNFRSTDNVLTYANDVLDLLNTSYRMSGTKGAGILEVSIHKYDDPVKEAEAVADEILETNLYSQEAVLYRTNAQSGLIQSELSKRKIPFTVSGGLHSFFNLPEIKVVLGYLRIYDDLKDVDSLRAIWNRPNQFFRTKWLPDAAGKADSSSVPDILRTVRTFKMNARQKKALQNLQDVLLTGARIAKTTQPAELVDYTFLRAGLNKYVEELEVRSKRRTKADIIRSLQQFAKIALGFKSLPALFAHVEYSIELLKESDNNENAVTLSTIHSAKGLEFGRVHLIGVEKDILPHENAFSESEETRLLYVAVTRAEDELRISHYAEPSPFLTKLKWRTSPSLDAKPV